MLEVINPATEELYQKLDADTKQSVEEAFYRARRAQVSWAKESLEHRVACVEAFRKKLSEKMDDLASVLSQEMGKPIGQARNEIRGTDARIKFFIENVASALERETVHQVEGKSEEQITYEPLGVIGNISAWNYPYFVGANVFIPALLTGNSVLYKPSELTPITGVAIEELMTQSGVPEGVFTTLVGGREVGEALLDQPLQGMFFTGSRATGERIAQSAGQGLMRVQLELGGKDPTYVCEDVDPKKAAEGLADGAFYNCGQSCCSVERIYVRSEIYDDFVDAFVKTVKGFAIGDPLEESTYIGPLARREQLKFLEEQTKDALDKGAKLICGGQAIEGVGYYFQPTVFTDVDSSMDLMKNESFGPIIGIQKVTHDGEAIQLMNETEYGLTAGIYTQSRQRAETIMGQVHAGSVYWNCCDRVSPRLPWTGWKNSGVGSTLGRIGIQAFVQPKAWHLVSQ